ARDYIEFLTGSPNTIVRLRFLRKGHPSHEIESTIDALWPHVLELQAQGYDCYYFLNSARRGPGSGYGGCAEDADVEQCRALAIDSAGDWREEWEYHSPPNLIVHTSAGRGQSIWPVAPFPKEEFEPAQRRLAAHYGSDPSICNPSRILRLPGTLRIK